jgi:hypothetical protein
MKIYEKFICQEDLQTVQDYLKTIKFNTEEDHVPLHNGLFEKIGNRFDIHTRGEMPDNILEIFSKYSKGMYEGLMTFVDGDYHPPMFSKHYIARFSPGSQRELYFNPTKPEGTYGSYLVWQNPTSGGKIGFPNQGLEFSATPGDVIVFEESEKDARYITHILEGHLFVSEAWMGKKGQLWMENGLPYEEVDWDNWEIKGFYE